MIVKGLEVNYAKMVDVCEIIKVLLKYKQINTDNNVFRLHYKFTVILLLLFSFLVTSKQYFGDPIDCDTGGQEKYIMDTYCWIHSTFTIKRHLRGKFKFRLGFIVALNNFVIR